MKRNYFKFANLLALAVLSMAIFSCQKEVLEPNDKILGDPVFKSGEPQQFIVMLNPDNVLQAELQGENGYDAKQEKMHGFVNRFLAPKGVGKSEVGHVFSNVFQGFSVKLNANQLQKLAADPAVLRILPDEVITLAPGGKKPPRDTDPTQVVPWGITRVNGGVDASSSGKTAWVVDSGVDLDHSDLNVDANRSRSFVATDRKANPDDQHGHGTHVAGTIAAIDNNIGVVGVAAGATVVSCRVLDRRGSGSFSWTIAACDYIAGVASPGDVVNMSLGPQSRYTDEAVDAAVRGVADAGVLVSLAAGNESDDSNYYSPARTNYNGVYTISAMDSNDNWASFSNYGSVVDYCEPGVSIYSTYKGGAYATMSGTSMAAPHFAGLLLLGQIQNDGFVNGDPDGNADPIGIH